MNNFTKDELKDIKHGIDWIFEHQAYKDKAPILELGHKIQSMIDDYCEHEKIFHLITIENKKDPVIYIRCDNCGKKLL